MLFLQLKIACATQRKGYLTIHLLIYTIASIINSSSAGDFFFSGSRAPCSNEGEEIVLNTNLDMKCFRCICQVNLKKALVQCLFSKNNA